MTKASMLCFDAEIPEAPEVKIATDALEFAFLGVAYGDMADAFWIMSKDSELCFDVIDMEKAHALRWLVRILLGDIDKERLKKKIEAKA